MYKFEKEGSRRTEQSRGKKKVKHMALQEVGVLGYTSEFLGKKVGIIVTYLVSQMYWIKPDKLKA